MYELKLYCTFEDINNYIRAKVDPKYKNSTFIPIVAEVNTTDLSIEVSLVEATSLEGCDSHRFKLELSTQCDQDVETGFDKCYSCTNQGWDMGRCAECIDNNFKYFQKENEL